VKKEGMTIDRKKSLLEALKQTLTDEFNKGLIETYAEDFNYNDLEQAFREQLNEEMSHKDETQGTNNSWFPWIQATEDYPSGCRYCSHSWLEWKRQE